MPISAPLPGAVLFVTDVPALIRFYRGVASMTMVYEGRDHAVLETFGFQLTIHALRGEPAPSHNSSGNVLVREDSYWKLCFPVESIAAARLCASELGGFIKPHEHEWKARGFRACDGHDPEGNVLQVRESAA